MRTFGSLFVGIPGSYFPLSQRTVDSTVPFIEAIIIPILNSKGLNFHKTRHLKSTDTYNSNYNLPCIDQAN